MPLAPSSMGATDTPCASVRMTLFSVTVKSHSPPAVSVTVSPTAVSATAEITPSSSASVPGAMSWGVISTYRPSVSSSIPVISRYTVSASTGSRNNEKRAAANITDSSPPATNFLSIPNPPDFFRVSSRNPRKIIAGLAADSVQPTVNDLPFVSEVPLSIREYSTAIFRHFTFFELMNYILWYNLGIGHNMW